MGRDLLRTTTIPVALLLVHLALPARSALAQTAASPGVLYGSTGVVDGGRLLRINMTTGAGTLIGATGLPGGLAPSLAIDSQLRIFAASSDHQLYRLDGATGASTVVGPTGIGDAIEGLAFDLNGTLYGVTVSPSNLYTVNPSTGAAALVGACGVDLAGLAVDPLSGVLWGSGAGVGTNPDGIFTVNKATGAATLVGLTGLGGATPDIAFDRLGNLFGVKGGGHTANNNLIRINKTNGAGVVVGPTGFTAVSGLGFALPAPKPAKADQFWASTGGPTGGQILRVNETTGAGTSVGPSGLPGVPALAIDGHGNIFAAERFTGKIYRIDAETGAAQFVGPSGVAFLDGLTFDFTGKLYASGDAGFDRLYSINTTTGAATVIGPIGDQIAGLAFSFPNGNLYGCVGGSAPAVPDGIYTINTTTGAGTLIGTTGLGGPTTDIAFDWDGRLFGVKGGDSNPSTLIAISDFNGAGSVIGPIGFTGVSGLGSLPTRRSPPNSILASQGGTGDEFWTLDPATGAGFKLGNMGIVGMPGLAIDSQGRVFGTSRSSGPTDPSELYRVDAFHGFAVLVGGTGVPAFDAIAFDASDKLYGFGNWGPDALYSIDPNTGTPTLIANLGILVQGAAFDPTDGKLWVSAIGGTSDEIYTVSKFNGSRTLVGRTMLGEQMQDLQFDALGRLYGIAGGGSSPTTLYRVNKSTGVATAIGPTGVNGLSGMASWPRLRTAAANDFYGSRGESGLGNELLKINRFTGAGSLIGNTRVGGIPLSGMPSLAIDSKGRIYTSDFTNKLYVVDALSAEAILVGPTGAGDVLEGLAFDANDNLYGVNVPASRLYRLDPLTGVATLIGATGVSLAGLAFDPTTGVLWASGAGCCGGADNIYTLNKTTAAATLVGVTGLGGATPDICFDALGGLYGSKAGNLISINKATAAGAIIGPIGFTSVSGLASAPVLLRTADPHVIYASQGDAGDQIYRINSFTGAGTLVGHTGIGAGMPALAIDSQGRIFAAERASGDLYRVDALTGAAVFVASTGISFLDALAFNLSDVMYASGDVGLTRLYTVNPSTGVATPIGPTGEQMAGLAFDPTSGKLYGSAGGSGPAVADGIYTVNAATGAGTLVGVTGLGGATPDLAFDFLGNLYGVKGGGPGGLSTFIKINKATGAGSIVGPVGFGPVSGMGSFEFTVVDAPEATAATTQLELLPAFPNPFSASAVIRFVLPASGEAHLDVYNVAGRKVATLVNGRLEAGPHTVTFDVRQIPSGVYFPQLQFAGVRKVQRVVVMR